MRSLRSLLIFRLKTSNSFNLSNGDSFQSPDKKGAVGVTLLFEQVHYNFCYYLGPGGADPASASEVHYYRGEGLHCM